MQWVAKTGLLSEHFSI